MEDHGAPRRFFGLPGRAGLRATDTFHGQDGARAKQGLVPPWFSWCSVVLRVKNAMLNAPGKRCRWPLKAGPQITVRSAGPMLKYEPAIAAIAGECSNTATVARTPWTATRHTWCPPCRTLGDRAPRPHTARRQGHTTSPHRDLGKVLRPALRGRKFFTPSHRPRIEVMTDEQPGRLIDQNGMRLGQQLRLLRHVECGLSAAWSARRSAHC